MISPKIPAIIVGVRLYKCFIRDEAIC